MKKRFFQKMFSFVFALTMLGSILCGAAVIPLDKETEAPAPFALSDVCSVTYRNGSGQQITITNRPMLEQFVALMNAAGAKPSQVNPNLPNGIGFAVRGQGWEIGYTLGSLPQDVQAALDKARQEEPWPLARNTLDLLWSNLSAAKEKDLPICQDTGMACVFVELGTDVHIDGSFETAIHEGVRRGYTDGYLRKSIVADPLRRGNTGDNTPAAITVHLVDGEGCRITVAPKGFGSENMSRIQMLKPADGVEGFKKFVVETVKLAGSNPCPPIVLGIGVGGSFDKVAYLAKKALLRPLDVPNPDPYYAQLEQELLTAINGLGIGPQGFGGRTTCLGLAIEQTPTHVAGLPVAVNVSCHVTRRASAEL